MRKADRNKKGMIFNIQKFSVNDGPGIRTVVFLKGCPLHCQWCANPESQYSGFQVLWDMGKCVRCHHCIETCSKKAISFFSNEIKINPYACSGCKKCIQECPNKAPQGEGEEKTVQEVLDIVLQDKVFYEESNGGITLSGGEILYQPKFALEILLAAKEEGLHTCCETTGFVKTETFKTIIEQVDYILFDMKHWDSQRHKEGTGIYNELILSNMKYAVQAGKIILPRIPVIPDYNDSIEDAVQFANLLKKTGITTCQLLPFHQFGENKYDLLTRTYAYKAQPSLHKEDLTEYQTAFLDNGVDAYF